MVVPIEEIKRLRELTGVGMTDAKKALEESKGNFDKALAEMRKKGLTKVEKRSERETRAGVIGTYNHDNRIGVIVEVNCETDFVARNEIFLNLVKDITLQIAASNPEYISIKDVKDDVKNIVREEYVDGQLTKYFNEKCLLEQAFVKNPDQTVGDYIKEHSARFGENIVIRRFKRMALGEVV
jgi:elongation factor Ts